MRRRLVALTATALTLAGCSGGGDAPTTSAASSPSESMTYFPPTSAAATSSGAGHASSSFTAAPSPVSATADGLPVPVMPAAAKANTPDGAAAFARYYIDLVNYAWQKPDPAPMRAVSDPGCKTCAAWSDISGSMQKHRERVDAGPLTVRTSDPSVQLDNGEQMVVVIAEQKSFHRIEADGSTSAATKGEVIHSQWYLKRGSSGWKVLEIENIS